MAKATRTSVSVPPELKARMDAVSEPVNWSALACRAFEDKLAEIIKRKGSKDMKEVVDRLRASKAKLTDVRYKEGFELGEGWAKNDAEAEELERLQSLRDRSYRSGEWETIWGVDGLSEAYPGGTFVETIAPSGEYDRPDDFWGGRMDQDWETLSNDPNFVMGFADGALDVWRVVRGQL